MKADEGAKPLWRGDAGGAPIRIGVSSCLLGEAVRFDGGHKRSRFLTDVLGSYVEWVPVCPEVELGLGTPREPIRLVADGEGVRLVAVSGSADHTRSMARYAARRVRALARLGLGGYVLKKDSPSCGMERVKVWRGPADDGTRGGGPAERRGRGLFAEALLEALPGLPVEEEGRLEDPVLRENWIERVFAWQRLRALLDSRPKRGDYVRFHAAHKLQLLAHSPTHYRTLGRLVAEAKALAPAALRARYEAEFMAALARRASRGRNANVLEHAAGHLKKRLDAPSRGELHEAIHDYRRGLLPLVVPVMLLRHHVRREAVATLADQTFLEPHPKELMLRNHV